MLALCVTTAVVCLHLNSVSSQVEQRGKEGESQTPPSMVINQNTSQTECVHKNGEVWGLDYTGTAAVIAGSSRVCATWYFAYRTAGFDSLLPAEMFADGNTGRTSDYCRNPIWKVPWCFIGEGLRDFCAVPQCGESIFVGNLVANRSLVDTRPMRILDLSNKISTDGTAVRWQVYSRQLVQLIFLEVFRATPVKDTFILLAQFGTSLYPGINNITMPESQRFTVKKGDILGLYNPSTGAAVPYDIIPCQNSTVFTNLTDVAKGKSAQFTPISKNGSCRNYSIFMFFLPTDCYDGRHQDGIIHYSGNVSVTRTGTPCLRWNVYELHETILREQNPNYLRGFPEQSLTEVGNKCRTPYLTKKRPWCYSYVGELQRPVDCDIPACSGPCEAIELISPQNVSVRFEESPYGPAASDLHCFTTGRPFATATCVKTYNESKWINVTWISCPLENKTEYTQTVKDLADSDINSGNVQHASSILSNATRNAAGFSVADVTYAAKALAKMADVEAPSVSVTTSLVEVVSKLMDADHQVLDRAKTYNKVTNTLIAAIDKIAASPAAANRTIVQANVIVRSSVLGASNLRGFGIKIDENPFANNNFITIRGEGKPSSDLNAALVLPVEEIERTTNGTMRASFIAYRTNVFFPTQTMNGSLNLSSYVISASINGRQISDLLDPVVLFFRPLAGLDEKTEKNFTCTFWNLAANSGRGGWSHRGCFYKRKEGTQIVCHCNHLTNFAVLADWSQTDYTPAHKRALSVISIIGLSLSSVALLITLLTILSLKQLRKERRFKIVMHLSLSLLAANLLVLVGLERTQPYALCCTMAALLHYVLLTAFSWMFVQVFYHYLCFVRVLPLTTSRFILKAAIPAYGIPACVVLLVAAVDRRQFRGRLESYCWLGLDAFYYAFMLPIVTVVCVNLGLFIRIMWSLWRNQGKLRSNQEPGQRRRLQVTASAACFVVTGLTWTFAFVALQHARLVFQYLFCVFSSLQGVFIFVFHVVSDRRTRQAWFKWFPKKQKEGTTISATTETTPAPSSSKEQGPINMRLLKDKK